LCCWLEPEPGPGSRSGVDGFLCVTLTDKNKSAECMYVIIGKICL
jgi:hypothetical protein